MELGVERSGATQGGAPRGRAKARRKASARRKAVVEWVIVLGVALVVALVVRTFVVQSFSIPSRSMVPTLEVGDRVLVNKLSYRMHDPGRGDVVVFKAPHPEKVGGMKDLVKRIVGLPGETIEGRDGRILVNGKLLAEPYLPSGVRSKTFPPARVLADAYWVLGDNRLDSADSTAWGPLGRSYLIGRVFVRLWPPSRVGGV